ncbi:MAG TPA: L-2-amino-thiazoline-4-carboxylic acid hydrolase [candidate division Zixibacteria bacterium]|nr:L-2-amino-thiazoline-4-carboxylic acid hydrolase [candidate division Zixibacteria bacterium]
MDFNETLKTSISLDEFLLECMRNFNLFLELLIEHSNIPIKDLILKYSQKLESMEISSVKNEILKNMNLDYSDKNSLNNYQEIIPLIENSILQFLKFKEKYEVNFSFGQKLAVFHEDYLRAGFFSLYYLAYTLIDFTTRDFVLDLARKFSDAMFERYYQKVITKKNTINELAEMLYKNGCLKTHNFIVQIDHGKCFVKVVRCMYAEVYSELPDLELACMLDCYGDYSKMPYNNPDFVLSRTKTMVEGYPYCDFLYYDKRYFSEIEHPDEDFWEGFE